METDNNAKSTNAEQPAFPNFLQEGLSANSHVEVGLTKREYFAAMAMQGLCSTFEVIEQYSVNGGHLDTEAIAKDSVSLGDALLEQLNQKPH